MNKKIQAILFLFLSFSLFAQTDEDKKYLKSSVEESAKNCPVALDEKTTMVTMAYNYASNIMEYQFTFDGVLADNFEVFKKSELINKWKTTPDQNNLIKFYRFKLNYIYHDLSGNFLTKITISPEEVLN